MEDQGAAGNRFAVVLRREWDLAGRPSLRNLARKTESSGPALSHGMIYSTLRGDSLPSSWENAKCVVEAVLDFRELSGFRRNAFVAAAKDIYVEENKKRALTRSALRQGAEAQHLANHALPAQDVGSDGSDEEPFGEAVRQAQVLVVERARDLGPDHPDTFDARQDLAYWTGKDGSPAKAAMLFREIGA